MIACSNPKAQYLARKHEIDTVIGNVLESGWYILGHEVKQFEHEFANYIGVKHGIGVANGTDALHLALVACGIGKGDEVITVSHTAVATAAAIVMAGASPVFVDIEPDFFTMNPSHLESVISENTKAIIPVHLYGQAANLAPIIAFAKKHNLYVLEDVAQALGVSYHVKRLGSFGDLACFSFYPTKNLGALGDGGMVVTDNPEFAEKIHLLRQYVWKKKYVSYSYGYNSRLDELQAAILRVKLPYLDMDNQARKRIAQLYKTSFVHHGASNQNLTLPKIRHDGNHVFHLYVIHSSRRDSLKMYLQQHEIGTIIHYPVPVHLQPAYTACKISKHGLAETEKAVQEILSLPMYPELTADDVLHVVDVIRNFKWV